MGPANGINRCRSHDQGCPNDEDQPQAALLGQPPWGYRGARSIRCIGWFGVARSGSLKFVGSW
jgi:hypothetical protein